MNSDSSNQDGAKADLYTIIKRRRRTVRQYLQEHNIKNIKEFESFVNNLKIEFIVNEKFIMEGRAVFKNVVKEKHDAIKPKKTITNKKKTRNNSKISGSIPSNNIKNN